jgi:predicted nucleic acid-binding protein
MSVVVLDTDVASRAFRLRLPAQISARLVGQAPVITFVTLGELTKWTQVRSWGPQRRADLDKWIQHVGLLPYDRAVAVTWGTLQAKAQLRGRPRPTNDTWIAACCLVYDLSLATLNRKDFEDFAEHDGLRLLDG